MILFLIVGWLLVAVLVDLISAQDEHNCLGWEGGLRLWDNTCPRILRREINLTCKQHPVIPSQKELFNDSHSHSEDSCFMLFLKQMGHLLDSD